jgi:DNA-binding transcriptional MerR regulator
MATMSIGELVQRSGVNAPTIRYYEEIGLLRPPARKPSGHRAYSAEDEHRLTFIRRCRAFGFSIEEVKTLSALTRSADRSCFEARDLAQDHLTALRATLAELRALEKSLQKFVRDCDAQCIGGPGAACVILDDLSKNALSKGYQATRRSSHKL